MAIKKHISNSVQRFLLHASYLLHRPASISAAPSSPDSRKWIIGVHEIASMLWRIHKVIPQSTSVILSQHPWYSFEYDYQRPFLKNKRLDILFRQIYGAWMLGKFANKYDGFIYLGAQGFLDIPEDFRQFEFAFLKSKGKKIVCYFTGSEIRSHKLTKELSVRLGAPNLANVREAEGSVFASQEQEEINRSVAVVADTFADAIFNWPVEQISYLESDCFRFTYAYPINLFHHDLSKFDNPEILKIVHAPSHKATKGTEFVRAAVKRLHNEGFRFQYVELENVSNEEVLRVLANSHIVLNQFNQYTPCVFGIEAMANCCVMLCSADENIEKALPEGANKAWVVTRRDEIYTNLRELLENPSLLKDQAERGFQWSLRNESSVSAGKYINEILQNI